MAPFHDIKPDPYRSPTMEEVERGRSLYQEGFTVSRILAATGMSLGTLYYWLDGGPLGADGARMLPPIPRRRAVVARRKRPLAADRVSLAARLYRTAERQARDIELHLARPDVSPPERERDVRMLSLLVRALRDLNGLGSGLDAPPAATAPEDEEPVDVEALRAELARRVANLRAQRREEEEEARAAGAASSGRG